MAKIEHGVNGDSVNRSKQQQRKQE